MWIIQCMCVLCVYLWCQLSMNIYVTCDRADYRLPICKQIPACFLQRIQILIYIPDNPHINSTSSLEFFYSHIASCERFRILRSWGLVSIMYLYLSVCDMFGFVYLSRGCVWFHFPYFNYFILFHFCERANCLCRFRFICVSRIKCLCQIKDSCSFIHGKLGLQYNSTELVCQVVSHKIRVYSFKKSSQPNNQN